MKTKSKREILKARYDSRDPQCVEDDDDGGGDDDDDDGGDDDDEYR